MSDQCEAAGQGRNPNSMKMYGEGGGGTGGGTRRAPSANGSADGV